MEKISILIVEDNYIVMMELASRLAGLGYKIVDSAASGLEAVEKAELYKPDLIIMDIRLKGGIDGIEAASRIKKKLDLPVIYLTAHTDEETIQRAKLTEPFGYIIKPFEERELHSTIEMALYKYKMEGLLKENKHWLSAALKSIGDALIATDSRGIIKIINPVAEQITGWPAEKAAENHISDVFILKDELGNPYPDPVTSSLTSNSVIGDSSKILISCSGNEIPVDFSVAPILYEVNSLNGAVLVFRDITERIKSREIIEKQKVFLRNIIDTDPNYISVKDSDGTFKLTNKAIAEALGTTSDAIIGRPDTDYFPGDNVIYHRKFENDIINSDKEIYIPEDKLVDAGGRVHLLQTFKRSIKSETGSNKLILTVASDITQLKETEIALRKSEESLKQKADELAELNRKLNISESELRASNESKDKFFSIIAHDLRSPFTALLGLSQYLVEEFDSLEKSEILPVLEDILSSTKATFSLLENLLQWARIKNRNIKFEPGVINIKNIINKVVNTYKLNASRKNIDVAVNSDGDIDIFADPNMINVIFSNLLSNAIKFTHNGGKIIISAAADHSYTEIRFSDNGIGIGEDKLLKLFKIGENISTKGTNNEEGAGIGLILTKEFVELNKGTIRVESSAGKGSEFIMQFPKPG
jgi:PAS domain S-box-containing protein